MGKHITIAIAEPSEILRKGLHQILKKIQLSIHEIVEIDDPVKLQTVLSYQQPDILIINPSILGGFSLSRFRKDISAPDLKIVALQLIYDNTLHKYYDEIITIGDNPEAIKSKLLSLLGGGRDSISLQDTLSEREKEVLVCVVKGMTNKQIAEKLFLSTHTVITHRRNISAKLDIHSTAGLTIYAIVNKLIEVGR